VACTQRAGRCSRSGARYGGTEGLGVVATSALLAARPPGELAAGKAAPAAALLNKQPSRAWCPSPCMHPHTSWLASRWPRCQQVDAERPSVRSCGVHAVWT
jgi:hypothetical protein